MELVAVECLKVYCLHLFLVAYDLIYFILANYKDMLDEFEFVARKCSLIYLN